MNTNRAHHTVDSATFQRRFTSAERAAIDSAAARSQNELLGRHIATLQSPNVRVFSPEAQLAKEALVAAGLLTAVRANEIFVA